MNEIFTDEFSSISAEEIPTGESLFANYYFGVTLEQLEELKAGRALYAEGEYGIFLALVDELPSVVKKREADRRAAEEAAELEEFRKKVKPGAYVRFVNKTGAARTLKVAEVSDKEIIAGFRRFPRKAFGKCLFLEEADRKRNDDGKPNCESGP